MSDENLKCKKCGKPLEQSQYADNMNMLKEATRVKMNIGLVCRNYPDCPLAEKEFNK